MTTMRRSTTLENVGALAAVITSACLVVGLESLALGQTAARNWLVLLQGINSGLGGVALGSLRAVNTIDIAILALSALAFAGFWPGPGRPHRLWMGLAIALPLAGIGVLLATGLSGRSGLMSGAIVLGVMMLMRQETRALGAVGVAANALLLVGDFATVGGQAPAVAAVVVIGYALLIVWFVWIASTLAIVTVLPGAPSHP